MPGFDKYTSTGRPAADYDGGAEPDFPSYTGRISKATTAKGPSTFDKVKAVASTLFNFGKHIVSSVKGRSGKNEIAKPPTRMR